MPKVNFNDDLLGKIGRKGFSVRINEAIKTQRTDSLVDLKSTMESPASLTLATERTARVNDKQS